MINIGIIGVGRWGTNYFRAFNKFSNAKVSWLCSAKEKTLKEALSKVRPKNKISMTTSYKDILKDEKVDAVAIATNGSTHSFLAKEALKSGKHVIVEKPMAFTSKEIELLINLSNKKKKILMVSHIHRFNPAVINLKEDIEKGLLGKINCFFSCGAGNGPIRKDMSAMWDFFPHDLSILTYLTDSYPLWVSANGASYINRVEDIVTMDLIFPNNIFASAVCSWIYPIKKRELVVVGDRLYAVFDDYAEHKLRYYKNKKSNFGKNNKEEHCRIQQVEYKKPLSQQLLHFLECVEHNKKPLTDGYEAMKVTRILECAQKSIKLHGTPIRIPKVKRVK